MPSLRKPLLLSAAAAAAFLLVAFAPALLGGPGASSGGLDFNAALGEGWWVALGVVFVGGLLTSLTPCVYPLIPITVAIFGARQGGRAKGALLSTLYVLGMATMYTGLGVGAALTGKAFGSVMSNPWVMGSVALVFIAFAASMFGAFEINLPPALQNRASQLGGEGWLGAFVMGLVSGVVAAPCTGPVLGGVLAWVATTQDALLGGALLFTFALGMGVLFWVLGTFSVSVPKSGPWMDTIKSLFGVVMLAVALFFLKDAFPPLKALLTDAAWVPWATAGAAALGIWLGGLHRTFSEGPGVAAAKGAGVLLLVGALFLRAGGLTVVTGPAELRWLHSEAEGLAAAAEGDRALMIDFTADWCAACGELTKYTFSDPAVAARLGEMVLVKIDATDEEDPEIQRLFAKYKVPGLPFVALFEPGGEGAPPRLRPELTVVGFLEPGEFLERLGAAGVKP